MDLTILEDIGLTKAEIDIYIALIDLGSSTSGKIIEKTGRQSSVIHRALKSLIAKSLITFVKIGKDNHYKTTNPRTLMNYIDDKRNRLANIMTELEKRKSLKKDVYNAEMFIGKVAIFRMLLNLISDGKQKEQYLSFSLIEPHDDKDVVLFYKNFNIRRREKALDVKVLVNKKVKSIYEKNYTEELLKKAHVRYTNFHFPQGLIIFRDKVIFLNWQDQPIAIQVTNQLMAKQYMEFFMEFYNKEKDAY